jgi:hypothetical protein
MLLYGPIRYCTTEGCTHEAIVPSDALRQLVHPYPQSFRDTNMLPEGTPTLGPRHL